MEAASADESRDRSRVWRAVTGVDRDLLDFAGVQDLRRDDLLAFLRWGIDDATAWRRLRALLDQRGDDDKGDEDKDDVDPLAHALIGLRLEWMERAMATEQETILALRVLDYVAWLQVDRGPAPYLKALQPRYECLARDVSIGWRHYVLKHKAAHLADCIEMRKPIFSPKVHTDAEAVARLPMIRAQQLASA